MMKKVMRQKVIKTDCDDDEDDEEEGDEDTLWL